MRLRKPPEVFHITDGIWCIRDRAHRHCSYIVRRSPGAVLIDSGGSPDGGPIMMGLQHARVGLHSIRLMLLTHWHAEHAAGAAALKKRTGCGVAYSRRDREHFVLPPSGSVGTWDRIKTSLTGAVLGHASPMLGAPAIDADKLVGDGECLEDDFEVIETPGHTDGHLSFYYRPAKALFTGDALSVRAGRLEPPAGAMDLSSDATRSIRRAIDREPKMILPGRSEPLIEDVESQCGALLLRLEQTAHSVDDPDGKS